VVTVLLRSSPSGIVGKPNNNLNNPLVFALRTGSGFFIGNKGYFVTNEHVVQDKKYAKILIGEQVLEAKVAHISKASDLALLKVETKIQGLDVLMNDIEIGTDIYAIGFPNPDIQGIEVKLTKGIVSSKRGINGDDTRFQIDAAIQPGNSGGPICDTSGRVLGVVVSTLDSIKVVEKTGAIPQNVNYSIKASELLAFLRSRSIEAQVNAGPTASISGVNDGLKIAISKVGLVIISDR
jgi:S1-C subfamily serine protease